MSESEEGSVVDRRTQGKGDNRDGNDGDPADDFEDEPESEQAEEAQATITEFADTEPSETVDESVGDTAEGTEADSTDPSMAATADTTVESEAPTTDESTSGRFGKASDPDTLKNAYAEAEWTAKAREAGIDEGHNTAYKMDVVELDDGSRVFATRVEDATSPVVRDEERAVQNNLHAPKIVRSIGGHSCKCVVGKDGQGNDTLFREGIEGDILADVDGELPESMSESIENTMAAGYFSGNTDLHAANMVVSNDNKLYIIDHDAAAYGGIVRSGGEPSHISEFSKFGKLNDENKAKIPDSVDTRTRIYEMAFEIQSGERTIPVDESTEQYQYAQQAANKAVRAAVVDRSYDVPSTHVPEELTSPPDGYESADDYADVNKVRFVNMKGDVVEGEVGDLSQGLKIRRKRGGVTNIFDGETNRIVEILD